jgi:hypothetical protein
VLQLKSKSVFSKPCIDGSGAGAYAYAYAYADIVGPIAVNGTELKTAPQLSTQIAYAIKPETRSPSTGYMPRRSWCARCRLSMMRPAAHDSHWTLGLMRGPAAPLPPRRLMEAQGRVRMSPHGPRGDVNGALLDDGTVVRLPPPDADRLTNLSQSAQVFVPHGTES